MICSGTWNEGEAQDNVYFGPYGFMKEPKPIDWEYYRKGIGSKVVDMYKEAYESIEIPKYVDTVTPQYKPSMLCW